MTDVTINTNSIITVPISSVSPNSYNPNIMPDKDYNDLKNGIIRDGFSQHILVRVNPAEPDKYIIIDGEHRWRVMQELGATEIPVEVQNKTEAEAMIKTIAMNKFRGDFDSIKLAQVLVDLKAIHNYTDEQLEELLGYSSEEVQSYAELLDFDLEDIKDATVDDIPDLIDEPIKLENEFTVDMSLHQMDMVEMALSKLNKKDKAEALYSLCSDYLKTHFPDAYNEVLARQSSYEQADIDAAAGNVD